MKTTIANHTLLAFLGLAFTAAAEETNKPMPSAEIPKKATPEAVAGKPTARVDIVKSAADVKAPEQPKPAHFNPAAQPPQAVTVTPAPALDGRGTHAVTRGETLNRIAYRYGVSSERLAAWNHLRNPDRIAVGQTLKLPPPVTGNPAPVPPPIAAGPAKHSVRKGETLAKIARHYGVSVKSLILANANVKPERLQIGQSVSIPSRKPVPAAASKAAAPDPALNATTGGQKDKEIRITLHGN